MAKTFTRSVRDITAATVPDGTQYYTRLVSDGEVLAAVAAYADYIADVAAWEAEHPNQLPPPHAAVADAGNITLIEKVFVKWYFRAEDDINPGVFKDEVDQWVQVNTTNFAGLALAGLGAAAVTMYNARRTAMDLDPVV